MAVKEFAGRFDEFVKVTVVLIALRLAVIGVAPMPVVVARPFAPIVATVVALDNQST